MRTSFRLPLLGLLTFAVLLLSVGVGAAPVPMPDVVAALAGHGSPTVRTIVLELRLPRTALAALVGGGLALGGAVFQALLRNPLAEPYILGVSGGAAVGAVGAIALGASIRAPWSLPLSAFAGAIVAVVLVFRIAVAAGRSLDTRVLLLAGVVAGAFFNAAILLVLSLSRIETFRSAIFWMLGGLSGATWRGDGLLALYVVPSLGVLLALARPLNLLAVGEESAGYLGLRVERVKRIAYIATSLLVAACVAATGVIGFIGLVVPHALRLLWGGDHRLLLPASLLAGAAFLTVADTLARTVVAPIELPVGVVTALVGVPVFLVLLRQRTT